MSARPGTARPAVDRVLAISEWQGECLVYTGTNSDGYGKVTLWENGRHWTRRTHLVVWEAQHGPAPKGLVVKHSCDNRACVNILHLSVGTVAENNQEAWDRTRPRGHRPGRTTCKHGHDITGGNALPRPPHRPGGPVCIACKQCARETAVRSRARKKARA